MTGTPQFIHKVGLGYDYLDVVEIIVDIGKPRPVYGKVISTPSEVFEEGGPDNMIILVGTEDIYSFTSTSIRHLGGK